MTLAGVDLREQDVRRREGLAMTDQRPSGEREWEITTNTYIFAGVGALILGVLAYLSLGGIPNTIAAAVVGGLAGGALGLFF
jgi:hypothetical protein